MAFKKTMKKIGRQTWELIKMSFPSMFMYAACGLILIMLALGEDMKYTPTKAVWWSICLVVVLAYNAIMAYAQGTHSFEMLVSGNMRRRSMAELEGGYKISSHREAQEYRVWKGFVVGAILAIFPIVTGIVFGCNQSLIDSVFATENVTNNVAFAWVFLILLVLSGWSPTLFMALNASGIYVSYFWCIPFAILPVLINGFFYIAGAYGKRRKVLKAQELADRISQAQTATQPKINYGGLPGTKPRKRK